ncbi:protein phosphatase 2C domain-containing protein [Dactylosporangium aurantiacum]|uniref:Protein phosphatase 2C domain-containing protein n=1 Tax=Dactylosporangium aurantiacum TaxID=35754 RepID=A0A9Q9I964_9ACTN|nr:protein phosphatase 2C domain-containing protein [Dactylosporangium aurantiacum]MDG6107187.1 protein phosphatase 2C domain-containing protein [Dactylosporangium aurantiacum]UWZ51481.1 protein phosphatase 2C domain-containing protein [Dactylosporangium aurantiacum]
MTAACPSCTASTVDGDRFCESCGADLSAPAGLTAPADLPAPDLPAPDLSVFDLSVADFSAAADGPAGGAVWRSSRAAGGPCAACGGGVGTDGYCDGCGLRRGAGRDHAEDDLPGVSAVTDRGLRKGRNEDAYAIGVAGGRRAVVVCDGVSSAPDSDAAATTAAVEAIEVLVGGGDVAAAYRAASAAVAELADPGARFDAPACTFLAAVVEDGQVTVGWVGDSRAYWLDGDGARCLTVDDSLAGQLAAAGVDAAALRLSAQAAALTRWLGADAPAGDPHLTTLRPSTAGVLLLSSDGLTRYPAWTGAVDTPGVDRLARRLAAFARDAGGADNITVAAVAFDPGPPATDPSRGAP